MGERELREGERKLLQIKKKSKKLKDILLFFPVVIERPIISIDQSIISSSSLARRRCSKTELVIRVFYARGHQQTRICPRDQL